ncbi:MAG: LLM class flavin-dependent oxidoreductase [Gammaproteobacteria bacterium]|nr:LLM class flavin-dependent oxidoreductase [Gammaproteobacteria bacterium]
MKSDLDADALCRQAELAEAWGYDSFFLPESHFAGAQSVPDPILLLAAVAARTSKIKLGTSSYLLTIRNPLLAAEQIATLDRLCGGRLILGLGRGFQAGMLEAFGVTQRDKRAQFEDILNAMLAAWRGDYVGDPKRLLELSPRPQQNPHPPLWVAAFGPKAIAQAGSLGLPYLASPVETLAELEHNHELHRQALQEAQHDTPREVVIMRTVFISEDEQACARVRAKLVDAKRVRPTHSEDVAVDDWCLLGTPDKVREDIVRYQQLLGMTHLIAVRPRVSGVAEELNRISLQTLQAMRLTPHSTNS